MNAPLRRVGVVVLVLFGLLFTNLSYQQWYKAASYRTDPRNPRVLLDEYSRPRGSITLAGGETVAQSKETPDRLKYLRVYPYNGLYSPVVGYKPVNPLLVSPTGIERLQNDFLSGTADSQAGDRLLGMFTGKQIQGGNVILTLSKAAQEAAFDQLKNNKLDVPKGAVVAIDPKTGAIRAEVSLPSYDPNPIASHSESASKDAWSKLNTDPAQPLANRATSETLAPGSTMKVIVSAAALSNGLTPASVIPAGQFYQPPQTTAQIKNASPSTCPEAQITLQQALTVSCNTAYSRLCVEQLGLDKFKSMAKQFGFESEPKFIGDDKNVMHVAASHTGNITVDGKPDGKVDPPALAQSCIGQRDVRMTPLQGALIAATVANGGSQMRPYVIDTLQSGGLSVVSRTRPDELRRVVSQDVASDLQDMMVSVVENGTGKPAKLSGLRVGGKTGTAENGEDTNDHGWFIGFAMKNNEPVLAVAVLLESAGKGGSHEAARIAGQVIKAYVDERGNK